MKWVVAAVVGLVGAAPAHGDLRLAIANDVFSEMVTSLPPYDDAGFTNDLEAWFWRPRGPYLVGVRLTDRWITEAWSSGYRARRRDVVELVATGERTWTRAPWTLAYGPAAAPTSVRK